MCYSCVNRTKQYALTSWYQNVFSPCKTEYVEIITVRHVWSWIIHINQKSMSCVPGRSGFPSVWWVTSRTCVTPVRWERTRAAASHRKTAVTSRRSQQPRATRTSPASSPSSSGRWWTTWNTAQTAAATAGLNLWPSSSTMCLARGESQCDASREGLQAVYCIWTLTLY